MQLEQKHFSGDSQNFNDDIYENKKKANWKNQ